MLRKDGQDGLNNDYKLVAQGDFCQIWMSNDALKTYLKAPARDRARAERIMETLCVEGPENLTVKQFNSEGRHPSGDADGKKMAVFAIKSYQLRVYGGWVKFVPRIFQCPEATIKKQNTADQDQLKRVAKKIGE
jgi:hypothetical protein